MNALLFVHELYNIIVLRIFLWIYIIGGHCKAVISIQYIRKNIRYLQKWSAELTLEMLRKLDVHLFKGTFL